MNKLLAETFGTFWLVLGGCGSAVLAAGFPMLGLAYSAYHWHLASPSSQWLTLSGIFLAAT